MFNYRDYPTILKNMTGEVRNKVIDFANELLDQQLDREKALFLAIYKAEKWAKERGITVWKNPKLSYK